MEQESEANPLTQNPNFQTPQAKGDSSTETNWVPLIASMSAAALFLIIVGAVGYVCYKFRRSDNVGDANYQVSTFRSQLETKDQVVTSGSRIHTRQGSPQSAPNKKGDSSPSGSNNATKPNDVAHDIKLEDIADDWDSPRNQKLTFGNPGSLSGSRPGSSQSGYLPKVKKKDFGNIGPPLQQGDYLVKSKFAPIKIEKGDVDIFLAYKESSPHGSNGSGQTSRSKQRDGISTPLRQKYENQMIIPPQDYSVNNGSGLTPRSKQQRRDGISSPLR